MTQVQSISDDASQSFLLTLPNGEACTLDLWYVPLQIGWYFALTYKTVVIASMRVTRNQNMLNQFANLLPFGLACFTNEGQEPHFQEDFAAGNAGLYLLDETDMAALEDFYGG